MNRNAQGHRFPLNSSHLFSTPGNSTFFLFPLKVRVIGSRLYVVSVFTFIFLLFSMLDRILDHY